MGAGETTMALRVDVRRRRRQPEIMDQPDLEERRHRQALRGLERINWLSRSADLVWPALATLARQAGNRPVRVLDVATGAGDLPLCWWQKARQSHLSLHLEGCDISPVALAHARQRAAQQQAAVDFFRGDALAGDLPGGYDVVTCSLFLHHLDEEQAVRLLQRMARAAHRLVVVNDLERSWAGYALAWVGTRVLTSSPVVRCDGPRSVEGAFTVAEVLRLAAQAGLYQARVSRRWPCRYVLTWRRW
jgi:ubiquinone/menaquinone biosynthesis C-methylase UbiE